MGNNITSIETVYSDARIHQRDAAALLTLHRGELPEHCFLRSAAIAAPSADGMVPIGTFEWSGLGSRASMYKLFDALAAHIVGRFEGIVAWEDGSRSGLRIVNGKAECPRVLSVLARTRFGESSIDTHRAAAEALADVLAGDDTRARQLIRRRLDSPAAREAMHAMASTDDESSLTWTTRFNSGRGGVSIDVAGYSRFVEGEEARKLAEALDPRPRWDGHITVMPPTITGNPPVMVGLAAEALPIGSVPEAPLHLVTGFEHVTGYTLPDLQNRWRKIAADPRAFVEAGLARAKRELADAEERAEDESEVDLAEHHIYLYRLFSLLLDHAARNAKTLSVPTLTVEDYDAALLAVPGVTRVRRHGAAKVLQPGGVLRVMVADIPAEGPDGNYRRNEALLYLSRIITGIVTATENPNQIAVHVEPGQLPDGFVLEEDTDIEGTRFWPVWRWVHQKSGSTGPRRTSKAEAIDDAWDGQDDLP